MKNSITEMKNILQGNNNILNDMKEQSVSWKTVKWKSLRLNRKNKKKKLKKQFGKSQGFLGQHQVK